MRFGISTHLYHDQRLSRDHLAQIAAHGFEAVELFATRSHFDYHDPAAIAAAGRVAEGDGAGAARDPRADHRSPAARGPVGRRDLERGERQREAAGGGARGGRRAEHRAADSRPRSSWSTSARRRCRGGENNRTAAFRSVEEICRLAEPIGDPGRARSDPEPALGRRVAGRHAREGPRRAADRHLPRLRPRVPDGRRRRRDRDRRRAPDHDARARQQRQEGRPPGALRGRGSTGTSR